MTDREPSRTKQATTTAFSDETWVYDPLAIEPKWQRRWDETRLYRCDLDRAQKPFYNLMEFPYPSGEGLHAGHFYTYSGADAFGRLQRMRGHDVFQPMGFDAFGIHAENYALKQGVNPSLLVPRNIERFREQQMKHMGVAFNWERQVDTTQPEYYRWTQWLFVQLYRAGLAYRAQAPVNWCPSCLTTLADEQVIQGACERCNTPVIRRSLTQWFLKITDYAERLLDFSGADFTETTVKLQTNWIGRRQGAEITFDVVGQDTRIPVFSTRSDTLFGGTFLALSPEHPLVDALTTPSQRASVTRFLADVQSRPPGDATHGDKGAAGTWTGSWAVNPVNGKRIPIWVADYVLSGHGTGAVFAAPAHDRRDHAFARAHGLEIVPVVQPPGRTAASCLDEAYEGPGALINSGRYDGQSSEAARRAIVSDLQERGMARETTTYRLRDWLISRQRYWGPPIPIVYCDTCGTVAVPERTLPVLLPQAEAFRPLGTGESPLAAIPGFVQTTCPRCGGAAQRETDVSDNFLDSAWYYLRYTSTEFDDRPWGVSRVRKWLPVSQYLGGVEHSTLHHLYARFVWKALQDLGHIPADLGPEPFSRLRLHGTIVKDGRKMSKSLGNVVNPDDYVARYGADVFRTYMLFMGPFERGGDFRDTGIVGVTRFFQRVCDLATASTTAADIPDTDENAAAVQRSVQRAVKSVTDDIEGLQFNTAIASLMTLTNDMAGQRGNVAASIWDRAVRTLLLLLAPFAPHLTEELWSRRGLPYSIHTQPWPSYDPSLVQEQRVTLAVQVNGRVRGHITADVDVDKDEARRLALSNVQVSRAVGGGLVVRAIYVPGRLINLVVE